MRSQLVAALGPGTLIGSKEEGLRKMGKDLGHVDEEVWEDTFFCVSLPH